MKIPLLAFLRIRFWCFNKVLATLKVKKINGEGLDVRFIFLEEKGRVYEKANVTIPWVWAKSVGTQKTLRSTALQEMFIAVKIYLLTLST